jgi:hypothetical protein
VIGETRVHPEGLCDVLDSTLGYNGIVHLQHRFFHTGLAAAVPLDDCRLKGQLAQFGHLERVLAGLVVQLALVVPRPGVDPVGAVLVTLGLAQLVRLGVQHCA